MLESRLLYFPDRAPLNSEFEEWRVNGEVLGYVSPVDAPARVWLMFHGNAGQAGQRTYIRSCVPKEDAIYVMEYPGYGPRSGKPSMKTINAAASEALSALRRTHPGVPIGVIGESLGSGPASWLCSQPNPPERVVLIVPFDRLVSVAKRHFPYLPVGLLLRDRWDNVEALSRYEGRMDIFGARHDTIIPADHARALAKALPRATYHEMDSGHNDWSYLGCVKIAP